MRALLALCVMMTASLAVAWPALAQCPTCAITPGEAAASEEPPPLEIELEAGLDFDRILLDGTGAGLVRLMPDGSSAVSGGVEPLLGRVSIGRVIIRGAPNRAVRVDFPDDIELVGAKGSILRVREIVTNLPADPALDAGGQLVVDFGGELELDGESDGDFRGHVPIRADYL